MAEYFLARIRKGSHITSAQLQTIVDICVGAGHIGFASIVLPVILDKWDLSLGIFGLTLCFGFWYTAFRVSKGIK